MLFRCCFDATRAYTLPSHIFAAYAMPRCYAITPDTQYTPPAYIAALAYFAKMRCYAMAYADAMPAFAIITLMFC